MAGLLSKADQANPDVKRELEQTAAQTDFTAPGSEVDPNAATTAPLDPVRGLNAARDAVNRNGGLHNVEDEPATEAEQKEYERALAAIETALYTNDKVSRAIVDQLQPQDKIGSVVKATILVIQQVDERIDMDEIVVSKVMADTLGRIIDMAEQVKGMQFSEKELQAATGATWEGVMELFGLDEGGYEEMTQGMSEKDMSRYKQEYNSFLGEA